MKCDSAVDLTNHLILKPGWSVEAECCPRFEGTMILRVTYPAPNSDREQAPEYTEEVPGGARANFRLPVATFEDDTQLYRAILDRFAIIDSHEHREFTRVRPTNWAPFHPHRLDGMQRWGDPDADYHFGEAA